MGFIEEVQAWLRSGARVESLPEGFDIAGRKAKIWAALSELGHAENLLAVAIEDWLDPGSLEAFLGVYLADLRTGLGAEWPMADLEAAADAVLLLPILGEVPPHTDTRIAAYATRWLRRNHHLKGRVEYREWCAGLGLTDSYGAETQLGRTFLALIGREALQFAVELEMALSTGPDDRHRVSREALGLLAAGPVVLRSPADRPQIHVDSGYRLVRMGILEVDYAIGRFSVLPSAIDLVRVMVDQTMNPVRALVYALLEAQRGRVTTEATGLVTQGGADLVYARTIVHELRNIILPLSTSIDRLWQELEKPEPARGVIAPLRARIEGSLQRFTALATESARLSRAVEPERFALEAVVAEGIRASETERNGRIRVEVEGVSTVFLEGPRHQWVIMFTNLLRNAAQVRAGAGTVWVSSERDLTGRLHIFVDDDGPGVPEELRDRIFDAGVSTRGGTGYGLFQVRQCLLLSGGTVVCEQSPRGGARFHMHVTTAQG